MKLLFSHEPASKKLVSAEKMTKDELKDFQRDFDGMREQLPGTKGQAKKIRPGKKVLDVQGKGSFPLFFAGPRLLVKQGFNPCI